MPDPPAPTDINPDAIAVDDHEIGFPQVMANLIVVEVASLSVRSDTRRNPMAEGYNMKIPPATYDEAIRRPDSDHWLAAMRKEMNLMSEMNVYELVPLPLDRRAIGCRWVLEFKDDLKGGPVYKARLVAQGFSQIPGVDFGCTFAPVAKSASIRVISAHATANDWELDCFDANGPFSGVSSKRMFTCVNLLDSNASVQMDPAWLHTYSPRYMGLNKLRTTGTNSYEKF